MIHDIGNYFIVKIFFREKIQIFGFSMMQIESAQGGPAGKIKSFRQVRMLHNRFKNCFLDWRKSYFPHKSSLNSFRLEDSRLSLLQYFLTSDNFIFVVSER